MRDAAISQALYVDLLDNVSMELGITIPLQKFLKIPRPDEGDCPDLFFCWDAHRESIGGRSCLVLCNSATRFVAVTAMTAADWRRLEAVADLAIESALKTAGFKIDEIANYLDASGAWALTRTHGRKPLGHMNQIIAEMQWRCTAERNRRFQSGMTDWANRGICHCATREGYGHPMEWFAEEMERHGFLNGEFSQVKERFRVLCRR